MVGYASSSVVDTIGTLSFSTVSNCGSTFFSDELVHSTATSGFDALIAFLRVVRDPNTQRPGQAGHVAEVPSDLGGIDVDRADDPESLALRHLPDDAEADRTETEMQYPDGT